MPIGSGRPFFLPSRTDTFRVLPFHPRTKMDALPKHCRLGDSPWRAAGRSVERCLRMFLLVTESKIRGQSWVTLPGYVPYLAEFQSPMIMRSEIRRRRFDPAAK